MQCYHYVPGYRDVSVARADCQARGMELASIHSDAENELAALAVTGVKSSWIGLTLVAGTWQWDDGSPVDYTRWNSGEPGANTPCVWLHGWSGNTWNDGHCSGESQYVDGHLCSAPCSPSPLPPSSHCLALQSHRRIYCASPPSGTGT